MAIFQNANAVTPVSGFDLNSCRFTDGSSSYVKRTFKAAGGNTMKQWSFSAWVKRGTTAYQGTGNQTIFGMNFANNNTQYFQLMFDGVDRLRCNTFTADIRTTIRKFRDISSWYHILIVFNSRDANAQKRMRFYINGIENTTWTGSAGSNGNVTIPMNEQYGIGYPTPHYIGYGGDSSYYFDGYLAECYYCEEQILFPSFFGETDTNSSQWIPKAPADIKKTVTFGLNGFYLPFSNDDLITSFSASDNDGVWKTDRDTDTQFGSVTTDLTTSSGSVGQIIDKTQTASSGWLPASGQTVSTKQVTFDCGSAENAKIIVGAKMLISNTYNDGVYKWQGSQDGSSFSDIGVSGATFTMQGLRSEESIDITGSLYENTTAYRYYRWQGVSGTTTANNFWTEVIPLLKTDQTINVTSDLIWDTSNGISTIQVLVNGSTTYDDSGGGWFQASQAVSGKYLRFDFGTAKTYTQVQWVSQSSSGGEGTWQWQGSNDQSTWTNIGSTFTLGGSEAAYLNWYYMTNLEGNTTAYRYYQILGSSGNTNGSGRRLAMYFGGRPDGTGQNPTTVKGSARNLRISDLKLSTRGDGGSNPVRTGASLIGPPFGSSIIYMDGGGDWLSVTDSADLPTGTNDWTIEFRVNFKQTYTSHPGYGIMGQWTSATYRWSIYQSSNSLIFYANNGGTTVGDFTMDFGVVGATWYAVALERDGSTLRWYMDGRLISTYTNSNAMADVASALGIGNNMDGSYNELYGYLDEIRISNNARYGGSNYTVADTEFADDANTVLLIHSNTTMGSTTFTDSATPAHTISPQGEVMHVAPKFGTGMGAFNGTTDYVDLQNVDRPWTFFGYDDFTIDFWQWDWGGGNVVYEQGANSDRAVQIYNRPDAKMQVYLSTSGGSWDTNVTTAIVVPQEQWVHIALVRSSGSIKFYVNGVNDANFASVTQTYINNAGSPKAYIGAWNDGNSSFFNGWMDEFRISRMKARWTANFSGSLPSAQYKDDYWTTLLLHMDGGGGIVDGVPTLPGELDYFYDASFNAIFYNADGTPAKTSYMHWPGSGSYIQLDDANGYTMPTATDFTIECWAAFYDSGDSNNYDNFFVQGGSFQFCRQQSTKKLYMFTGSNSGSEGTGTLLSDMVWRHVAVARSGSTVKGYIEGAEVFSYSDTTNLDYTNNPSFGCSAGTSDWSMDNLRVSKGIARYTGAFVPPTEPFVTDQYTVLLMQSTWSEGGLGADHSGNYNRMTINALTINDGMVDSPNNNWAVLDPNRSQGTQTFDEGNLQVTHGSGDSLISSTMHCDKNAYWEVLAKSAVPTFNIGASSSNYLGKNSIGYLGTDAGGFAYGGHTGDFVIEGVTNPVVAAQSTIKSGGIIAFAYNATDGTVRVAIDGIWQNGFAALGTITAANRGTIIPSATMNTSTPLIYNFGQDSSFTGQKTSQGYQDGNDKGDFYYPVPSGYLAICTSNYDTPTFEKPEEQFNTTLYTGNASTQTVTGTGFKADITWIKQRNSTENHFVATSLRDPDGNKYFYVNTGTTEGDRADGITGWTSDGFTLGSWANNNTNTSPYASWNWLVNTSNVSNTNGSQTATQRVNTAAGWSVSYYSGTGSAGATFGHGLSQAPEFVWIENLSATHQSICYTKWYSDENYYFSLQDGDAYANSASAWNDVAPTASLVTLGNGSSGNGSGNTLLAFCFHPVPGFSKMGWWQGNGSNSFANTPMIHTGFRPAFILIKRLDATADWQLLDDKRLGYNADNDQLKPNQNVAEDSADRIDIYANGFKNTSNDAVFNGSGGAYFYMAFAQDPFKTANAR